MIVVMLVAIATTKIPLLFKTGLWSMAHDERTDFAMLLSLIFLLIVGSGRRSVDAQLFYLGYGGGWLVGSVTAGLLYDGSRPLLVAFSVAVQLASIPVFLRGRAQHE